MAKREKEELSKKQRKELDKKRSQSFSLTGESGQFLKLSGGNKGRNSGHSETSERVSESGTSVDILKSLEREISEEDMGE